MTGGKVDFSSLAASSLPSLNVGLDTSTVPSENSNGVSGTFPGSQQNGSVNVNRIRELSASFHSVPKTDPASDTSKTYGSIEELIQQRRHAILNDLFTSEFENTRQRCDKIHETRMIKEWENQKNAYMKEIVGDRRLGGSSGITKYQSMTQGNSSFSPSDSNDLLMDHVDIMSKWNQNADMDSIITMFRRLPTRFPAYTSAWNLVERLKLGKSANPIGKAISTLSHLGRQFQTHVANRVRKANANGQTQQFDTSKYSGMARLVATFVALNEGSQTSEWAIIYYCLRSGDFVSAQAVLSKHDRDHLLMGALDKYAKQQGTKTFYWDEVIYWDESTLLREKMTYSDQDDFEKACWSLLADNGEEPPSSVVRTIEDFIYVSLWKSIFGVTKPDEALAAVGENIRNLGPSHFQGGDSTDCWSYATPLLLTQQYRSAISHLAKGKGKEGIIQATHLCLFLDPANDLGVTTSQNLMSSLLIEFASFVQEMNASSALLYLVRIPDYDLRRKKIVELIVDSRKFSELGGTISSNGARQGESALLDRHFPPREVCDLLDDASKLAYNRKNTKDALQLLNLAERYVGLLSLLNKKLAALLIEDNVGERQFWFTQSTQFNNWHFVGARTRASEVLEAANREDLITVFQTLLKLSNFFNKLLHHDFENAAPILEELHFIPRSDDEVIAKFKSHSMLDPVLQEVFPSVMQGAMQVMYSQFIQAKHRARDSDNISTILKRLQERARLLNSLSNMLHLPLEVQSRMTNMEAQMV